MLQVSFRVLQSAPSNGKVLTRFQELIAPVSMQFFTEERAGSTDWSCLGDRSAMCDRLATITKIDAAILRQRKSVDQASVANRMSWASKRVTTKPEDMAYSLMGLFDVNMPMIYGEGGRKAFLRLQEEIIKTSNDQSIFAWTEPEGNLCEFSEGLCRVWIVLSVS